jgi:hypothetical protein
MLIHSQTFELPSEFQRFALNLISNAQQEVLICDPDWEAWSRIGAPLTSALDTFLRRSPHNRLKILLQSPGPIARYRARLTQSLTRFSHQAECRQYGPEFAQFPETLLIIDASSVLRKPEARAGRGMLRQLDADYAQAQKMRFLELWETSQVGFTPTTLGL